MVTYRHSILGRLRKHFSQLFNVHGVSDVTQTDIHTAEPLVPKSNVFEFEKANDKLKRPKPPGIDQNPAELIKVGGKTIWSEISKHINYIWNKEELLEEWKESVIAPNYKKSDKTDCSNNRVISLLPTTYKILSNILLSNLTPYAEEIIRYHQCGF